LGIEEDTLNKIRQARGMRVLASDATHDL